MHEISHRIAAFFLMVGALAATAPACAGHVSVAGSGASGHGGAGGVASTAGSTVASSASSATGGSAVASTSSSGTGGASSSTGGTGGMHADNTVSELSPTGATLGTFAVGSHPYGIAFDGTHMWVANQGDGTVTEL